VGVYANYSQGYVPPQITELFNSVKVPYLSPQTFNNYEVGGWLSLLDNKLYADWSVYRMNGTNEIISVRLDDGTFQNQNSGETRHKGVEYGLTYKPSELFMFRWSAANAAHTFIKNIERGVDFSGNEMSGAPKFISNSEVMFYPSFSKGLRLGLEWQHLGEYWMDNANTQKYPGFDVFNAKAGIVMKKVEVWINAFNILNKYYSTIASKSAYGYSYNLGDPREFNLGLSYRLRQ
jgi:outer membrane receptor protein involved in Fe transport